ncbi:MAG TPA: helix-turn-helix domain-containing protein [Streptosporangiaceae bacterium]|nr:helix-turn-helix domain-containing protein [Streptosporangiaceae bacterium]
MSVEAISWALNLAPVPADRGGQPSSACKFVLVGPAIHAGPDGTGAFPSVATLVRYTGLSERTVRTCLDRLKAAAIISECDPDIVAARIKRADPEAARWPNPAKPIPIPPLDDSAHLRHRCLIVVRDLVT